MQAEIFILGKSRVPPWAGDAMRQVDYDTQGNIIRAHILTSTGIKVIQEGAVVMRVNGRIAVLNKKDARKYGII